MGVFIGSRNAAEPSSAKLVKSSADSILAARCRRAGRRDFRAGKEPRRLALPRHSSRALRARTMRAAAKFVAHGSRCRSCVAWRLPPPPHRPVRLAHAGASRELLGVHPSSLIGENASIAPGARTGCSAWCPTTPSSAPTVSWARACTSSARPRSARTAWCGRTRWWAPPSPAPPCWATATSWARTPWWALRARTKSTRRRSRRTWSSATATTYASTRRSTARPVRTRSPK